MKLKTLIPHYVAFRKSRGAKLFQVTIVITGVVVGAVLGRQHPAVVSGRCSLAIER